MITPLQIEQPPLVVRLLQDIGKLPAAIAIQFPPHIGPVLALHRLARPVAAFDVAADLILDEDDMDQLASKAGTWIDQALTA